MHSTNQLSLINDFKKVWNALPGTQFKNKYLLNIMLLSKTEENNLERKI